MAIPTKAIAELRAVPVETRKIPTISLAGVWQDSQHDATMVIREQNGFLDVLGKDPVSMYSFTCLININSDSIYSCHGEGMNHSNNLRFLYKSTIQLSEEGTLVENWEASNMDKDKNGSAIFKRPNKEELREKER